MPAGIEVITVKESIAAHSPKRYGPHQLSHLVLLRIWKEQKDVSHGPDELHGKIQDPVSGDVQYFDGAKELVRILRRMISQREADGPEEATDGSRD